MTLALVFPAIDPVAIEVGPITVRWYALAYIAGLLLGWRYIRHLARRLDTGIGARQVDDLLVWVTLGVVFGGRLGHVFFYKPAHYFANPVDILYVWQGGMSFHGGLIGVAAAIVLFAARHRISALTASDQVVCAVPIGLLLGRVANFINGELYGRVTEAPWGMIFPAGGPLPRHPSQLYEAVLEGLVLFLLLFGLSHWTKAGARHGLLTGVFLAGYAAARIVGELFREPDAHLGTIFLGMTMGQLLSLPMLGLGLFLVASARAGASGKA